MVELSNQELITKAGTLINPKKVDDRLFADVGAALVSSKGNVYVGVCLDPSCGVTLCAEQSAIASMITAGEYKIKKIVAVWRDEQGSAKVLPPCGCCRELMRQINNDNLSTEIILSEDKSETLASLLPHHDWFN